MCANSEEVRRFPELIDNLKTFQRTNMLLFHT